MLPTILDNDLVVTPSTPSVETFRVDTLIFPEFIVLAVRLEIVAVVAVRSDVLILIPWKTELFNIVTVERIVTTLLKTVGPFMEFAPLIFTPPEKVAKGATWNTPPALVMIKLFVLKF